MAEVLDALEKVEQARARLGAALRVEQRKTGASGNELAEKVRGAMSRPLVLKALKQRDAASAQDALADEDGHRR
jgi:hypothetical protein